MKEPINEALLAAYAAVVATVITFSAIKAISSDGENRTFKIVMLDFLIAIPVGALAGFLALEMGLKPALSCVIASMFSLISGNLIVSIVNSKINFGELFKRAMENIIDKYTK
jgi:hypothetical protein